jgi:hypothetical protein
MIVEDFAVIATESLFGEPISDSFVIVRYGMP